ncbi:TolC family protein [Candidatus Poribacteria bacterium]|nr:TolC family protein [Candidatus Poribacteria bacterium]
MKKIFIFFIFITYSYAYDIVETQNFASLQMNFESTLAEKYNITDLINIAYQKNPKLKSVKYMWEQEIEKYPQAVSLDDPMFNTQISQDGAKELRLMQKIPYPGTLSAESDVIKINAEIAKEEYENTLKDLIVDIKINYFELIYLNEAITITEQNQELLNFILKAAGGKYANDKTSLNDLLKAESQLAQLSYDVITLKELKEVTKSKLLSLLNLSQNLKIGEPEQIELTLLDLKLDDLNKLALSQKQEIRVAALKIKQMQKEKNLTDKMIKPMFNVGIMYSTKSGLGNLSNDMSSLELGFNFPLWSKKNSSKRVQAELDINIVQEEKKDMENMTLAEIKEIFFRLENSKRLIKLYNESLLPKADKAISTVKNLSDEKISNISEVLETQAIWFNFNLALKRAMADYRQNLARLERAVGGKVHE